MPDITAQKQEPAVERVKQKKDMSKFRWTLHEMLMKRVGYFMVLPFLIMFITFTVLPVMEFISAAMNSTG